MIQDPSEARAASSKSDPCEGDPPSRFIEAWIRKLAMQLPEPRRAVDLAMGRGRHAVLLAAAGYRVFGVDQRLDAVRHAMDDAASRGLLVRGWCADLTRHTLPDRRFELAIVTRYLQRDLFPALARAVVPGGVVLYETFLEAQRRHGRGPTSPEHLLKEGELRTFFDAFDVLFYEETVAPEAVARIAARRKSE
jgi:SAM-dependent methyltransferase